MIPMAFSMLFIPSLSLSFCTVLPPISPIKAPKFAHFSLHNFYILIPPSLEYTPTITCTLTPFNFLISVIAAGYKLTPEDGSPIHYWACVASLKMPSASIILAAVVIFLPMLIVLYPAP